MVASYCKIYIEYISKVRTENRMIKKLNQTVRINSFVVGFPSIIYTFRILIMFRVMNTSGTTRKNKTDKYFSLLTNSWMLDTSVAWGIKALFIRNAAMIYSGILNHQKPKTDLSFAFIIASSSISWCFK